MEKTTGEKTARTNTRLGDNIPLSGTASRKRQRTSPQWAKLLEAKIADGDLPVVVRCLGGLGVDSCKTLVST